MKLFGKKEKVAATDNNEQSLYSKFKQSKSVLAAMDMPERTERERFDDVFQRSAFDTACEIVSFNSKGEKSVEKVTAMDMAEGASQDGSLSTMKAGMNVSSIHPEVWKHYDDDRYIGWTACAMLAQNPVIHLACHIPAEDAIAYGYNLSFADNKDGDRDKDGVVDNDLLTELKKKTEIMHVNETCVKLEYNKRVFGQGIAIPVIYGRDGKPYDMSNPFNADGLKKCIYKGWKVIDPYWLTPQFERGSSCDPMEERFMKPTWYRMPSGRVVHWTWFVKVDNAEVADILKPTYYYGGMPLTQMIYKRVWCAEKTANEAPLLAMSKRMLVVDANVEQMIKNKSYVEKLMKVITKCWHNFGVFFKSPTSNIQQIDTSLTDFEECMFSQYQLVAAIAQMPATKLLQTTPKGFNSTGEFEWKIYAQMLETIQNTDYKPLIEKHLRILTAIIGDKRLINVTFNPVDAPTKKEKAELEQMKAQTRCEYLQTGILTAAEVRSAMRNDTEGEYTSIPVENPDLVGDEDLESAMLEKLDGKE